MKIQLVSDLHLEFNHKPILENAGADVLVLAGDVCTARKIKDYLWFFEDVSNKFPNVVYILGNHERYQYRFNDTARVIREALTPFANIHFLDNEKIVLNGVKFLGATLWTDLNKGCPLTENILRYHMNDFRLIDYRDEKGNYFRFTPLVSANEHRKSVSFLDSETLMDDMPTVVVTHHAPSYQSIHPKYKEDSYMNGGYVSDLEWMMKPHIKLWCHGHTHHPFDYKVSDTRVVCNPHGYPGERRSVDTNLLLEV